MGKIVPVIHNGSPHGIHRSTARRAPTVEPSHSTKTFAKILESQQHDMEVKLSAHAQKRLKQRNINISSQDISRISDAVRRAEMKGARESLIMLRDLALVVNINNRTVITAMDKTRQKEKIFTNIDSTIIL